MSYKTLGIVLFLLFAVIGADSRAADEKQAREILVYYFDLVKSDNYESACGLWEPSSYARAARLGIEYDGIPVKIDFNSPVMQHYDKVKSALPNNIISRAILDSTVFRWKLRGDDSDRTLDQFYYTALLDGYYWIITPADYFAAAWPITETKYFRIYANPDRNRDINPIALQSLDNFVEKTAGILAIPPDSLDLLAEKKIDYYLCKDDIEVESFTGTRDRGVYDAASDAVVTTFLPHYHEVALLLLNFKLHHLPPVAQPFIRNGLATHFGGRWQRAPAVVFDFGEYILKYDIIDIDSILTYDDFYNLAGGDVSYPVSSCLADYIFNNLDLAHFLDLYRRLSGSMEEIEAMPADTVKNIIAASMQTDWTGFKAAFDSFMVSRQGQSGLIVPGVAGKGDIIIDLQGLKISRIDNWLQIEYTGLDTAKPDMNFLFDKVPEMDSASSQLFDEQYHKAMKFNSFRYGVKFDKNEIGLYDYATNQIRAKFIDEPGAKSDYYDQNKNRVTAYFDLSLIDGHLPDKDNYQILK